ncbi:MAG TPA: tetratricopeptide repeat protein [Terriglobales bacterium]|nr:tetratricopeptide repeat protein [Terriglobales bacterium]
MSRRLFVPLILLLVPCAPAQFASPNAGNVKVRITFTNDRGCEVQAHIRLMGGAGTTQVAEGFANDNCSIEFAGVVPGNYHVLVSGEGIVATDSGVFEVDSRKGAQSVDVEVKRAGEADPVRPRTPNSPTVSAGDLNIPEGARKEFDKASDLMAKENWKKAMERLDKALALYPKYAAAYNNLGVIYGKLGDRAREREALQKAVSLNDHFAPAYANLAKMAIVDRNFPEAESLLNKATAANPEDSQTLVLLANVELLDQHYDEAIANCRKVHSMVHDSQALVHYIAARALEHENRPVDAVAEFQTFLKEEPSGPRAEAVRKEMAGLQAHIR